MAHQKSAALIIGIGLVGLAAAALAVSQTDLNKFPPISGEIFGQASPGVRSITVNGKPVSFDSAQNFKAAVNLHPGEKYLVLKINYEGLRIIKKYLILRKSAIKKFKVFVPKEKIEKDVQKTKQSRATERKALRVAQARQRALRALAEKERARILQAEREGNWLAKVPSPKFFAREFQGSLEIFAINQAVVGDDYGLPFKTPIDSIDRLNELIKVTNFLEVAKKKYPATVLSLQAKNLVRETAAYRGKPFVSLTAYQQKKINLLNRLLIETLYPAAPKRAAWWPTKPLPAKTGALPSPKLKEYLYVWEFSEGKLLVARETKGKYSAEVYIPVSQEWLDLRGISAEELRRLIAKPIKSYQEKKQ